MAQQVATTAVDTTPSVTGNQAKPMVKQLVPEQKPIVAPVVEPVKVSEKTKMKMLFIEEWVTGVSMDVRKPANEIIRLYIQGFTTIIRALKETKADEYKVMLDFICKTITANRTVNIATKHQVGLFSDHKIFEYNNALRTTPYSIPPSTISLWESVVYGLILLAEPSTRPATRNQIKFDSAFGGLNDAVALEQLRVYFGFE